MYSNPDWSTNGLIIISMGLSLLLIGSFILMRYRKKY
jgi:LPXTG-motif cell wall-anchored protein